MTEANTQTPSDTKPSPKGSGFHWIAGVVGLLAFTLTVQGLLLSRAIGDPSVVAEPDYYRKAVDWNQHRAQTRANEALGWTLTLEVAEDVQAGGRKLVATLNDRTGEPLEGAAISLLAFHKANASHRVRGVFAPEGPGTYVATAPLLREGRWELRFEVTRGDECFTVRFDRDVRGPRNVARTP